MKKNICLSIVVLVLLSCNKLSDFFPFPPAAQFNKVYGGSNPDIAFSIVPTFDGDYIMAGGTSSRDGDVSGYHKGGDAWIVKLHNNGKIRWQQTLGGSGDDIAYAVISTLDGGYAIAGATQSSDGDVSSNHGDYDAWIIKLANDGHIQWQKTLGGSNGDYATSIALSLDGGYIMAGWTQSNDGDVENNHKENADAWVVKLDGQGHKQWQKTFGGSGSDFAFSIVSNLEGGYTMAGYTDSEDGTISDQHGKQDAWIVKLDKDGNKQWQKVLGGSNDDQARSISATLDGGYIVAGFTLSNDGDVRGNHGNYATDAWVVKLDCYGNKQWQKTLGGSDYDWAYSIIPSLTGGYVMAGYTQSNDGDVSGHHGKYKPDAWVVKLDKNGNKQWQKVPGGSEYDWAYCVTANLYGGYAIAGSTQSNNGDVSGNHGSNDAWVATLKDN